MSKKKLPKTPDKQAPSSKPIVVTSETEEWLSIKEIQGRIKRLEGMIKKADVRLVQYEKNLNRLRDISETEKKKVDLGLKVFNLVSGTDATI